MKKEKELTEMQKTFIKFLFSEESGGNIRVAMDLAGYSRETRPWEVLKGISDEVREEAKKFLTITSAEAVFSLVSGMRDSSAAGIQNRIKAAESILNRAGIKEDAGDKLNLNIPENGLAILPMKKRFLEEADSEEDQ